MSMLPKSYSDGRLNSTSSVRTKFLVGTDSMNTDFKTGDVVRHKSGGKDITVIRFEDESVAGVTKKVAICGRFEGQNFHQETIPVEMLEFVNRWFVAGG